MTVISTRFAPSPTGVLHLGHAYCAVRGHDLMRQRGGQFLIRIDDIDGSRSRREYVAQALEDLRWLGLNWDGDVIMQSDHQADYAAALEQLRAMDLLYPCFCTRADIAASLSAPHGPSGMIYPGTCRMLSPAEQQRRCQSEAHSWRLDMAKAVAVASVGPASTDAEAHGLTWLESGDGNVEGIGVHIAHPLAHGDIILARKDAPASYHLASSVDDAMMRISHVVRGADLRQSTDIHRLLQALLGAPTPIYWHHRLICGPDGKRLAKRDHAAALESWKDAGMDGRELAEQLRQDKLPAGYSFQQA